MEKKLFWVILEVLGALAIAVAIVWWTFPKKKAERTEGPSKNEER